MTDLNDWMITDYFEVEKSDGMTDEPIRKYKLSCGEYVLYYANGYNGWDSLLLNGASMKTDNVEHLNYRKRHQSTFSKVNYQNNITARWRLKTHLMFGDEGERMYHLLESTKVYLHNLETDEIVPVVVTDSNCDYLNYTNNGKRPYFYEINVEESHLKKRK